jgi:hypothetical protein
LLSTSDLGIWVFPQSYGTPSQDCGVMSLPETSFDLSRERQLQEADAKWLCSLCNSAST